MSRYHPDIRYDAQNASTVGYWAPETPGFIENRASRIEASRKNNASYEEARKDNRNKLVQWNNASSGAGNYAFPDMPDYAVPRSSASIIDFTQIDAQATQGNTFLWEENPFDLPFSDEDETPEPIGKQGFASASAYGSTRRQRFDAARGSSARRGYAAMREPSGAYGYSASRDAAGYASTRDSSGAWEYESTRDSGGAWEYASTRDSGGLGDAYGYAATREPARRRGATSASANWREDRSHSSSSRGRNATSNAWSDSYALEEDRERDYASDQDEYEDTSSRASFADDVERRRHARRHRKAERAFDRAYGGEERARAQAASAEDAPRAAVYETKMGRTHQRAARMQLSKREGGAAASGVSALLSSVSFGALLKHRWFVWLGVTLIVLLMVASMLYPAAQNYYLQSRENDKLAAEYEAVLAHNTALGEQVAALQTDEGMEQLAHESLGWVSEGENSVSVADVATSSSDSTTSIDSDSFDPDTVATPDTWYSPMLDIVFGYSDDTAQ